MNVQTLFNPLHIFYFKLDKRNFFFSVVENVEKGHGDGVLIYREKNCEKGIFAIERAFESIN